MRLAISRLGFWRYYGWIQLPDGRAFFTHGSRRHVVSSVEDYLKRNFEVTYRA